MGAPIPTITRRERLVVAAITVAFTLVLVVWACVTSMFSAPDELNHFDAVLHIALGGGWPAPTDMHYYKATLALLREAGTVAAANRPSIDALFAAHPGLADGHNQLAQHPPTWYALGAALLHVIGFEHHRWDLSVLALRLMNVAMLIPLPIVTWAAVRRVTRSPRTAVVAAVALFAVPQLASIGSSVTNDVPIIVLGGVASWLVVRMLTGDHGWWTPLFLGLALAGLAATKGTGLPVIPFAAVGVLVSGAGVLTLGRRILRTVVTLAVPAVLASWWWLHNIVVYHALQPAGNPFPSKPWGNQTSADFGFFANTEWNRLTSSFWGQFGSLQYPMTPILTDALSVLSAGAILFYAFRRGPERTAAIVMALLPALTFLAQIEDNWSSYDRTQILAGAQGRYFFVALVPLLVLSAIAWRRLVGTVEGRARFGRVAVVAAPIIGLYGLTVGYRGFYENFHLQATTFGLGLMANLTPVGRYGLVAVLLVTAVVAVATFVVVRRFVRDGPVPSLPARTAPAARTP